MENKKELLKYMIFAGVMGIVVGGIDTVFGKGLILIGEIRNKYFWYLIHFLPIAGIVITSNTTYCFVFCYGSYGYR